MADSIAQESDDVTKKMNEKLKFLHTDLVGQEILKLNVDICWDTSEFADGYSLSCIRIQTDKYLIQASYTKEFRRSGKTEYLEYYKICGVNKSLVCEFDILREKSKCCEKTNIYQSGGKDFETLLPPKSRRDFETLNDDIRNIIVYLSQTDFLQKAAEIYETLQADADNSL